ncbi:MAG: hypothetical protein ACLQJ0_22995 [Steroidobacteraceae bacterium]|jgi:hypothetical protein
MKLFSRAPLATLLMLLPALGTAAAAEKQYGPGVTDTEIKIGNIMAYSGPASGYDFRVCFQGYSSRACS